MANSGLIILLIANLAKDLVSDFKKKTINELGWKTNYSLIKGIKLIINYHNKYKNRLNN